MNAKSEEEKTEFIEKIMGEEIEDLVYSYQAMGGRIPWVVIAREAAKQYRKNRKPEWPKLVVDDFREYLRETYGERGEYLRPGPQYS